MSVVEDMNALWQLVKENFKPQMDESAFNLWFGNSMNDCVVVSDYDSTAKVITLISESDLKIDVFKNRFLKDIATYFTTLLGFDVTVQIQKKQIKAPSEPVKTKTESFENIQEEPAQPIVQGNSKYNFDNFIVGDSNKFAYAACVAVAENPACLVNPNTDNSNEITYNPLFIHGPSGLGKTHLLYAILNSIIKRKQNVKVVYVTCEDFTNEMVSCLAAKKMNDFHQKYRNCDVLLIDDIQFLANKTAIQEELFYTFNTLYENHKQIIFTSDRPPKDINSLSERLESRFEWGLLADIQPPNLELRIAIIKKKSEQMNISISDEVLTFLAENIRTNIRQIEGAIKKLGAISLVQGKIIDLEMAQNCIEEILDGVEPVSVTISKIFNVLEKKYGFSKDILTGNKQTKDIANARHIAIYLIHKLTEMSSNNIGKIFEKDHSSILYSYKLIEKRLENDQKTIDTLEELESNINAL